MQTRPIAGPTDRPLLAALLRAIPNNREYPGVEDLGDLLEDTAIDRVRDTRLWLAPDGSALAMAWLRPEYNTLFFHLHPSAGPVADELLRWGAGRAAEAGGERGEPLRLLARANSDNPARVALLRRHGFSQEDWFVPHYERPLASPIDPPALPEGFTIRHVAGEGEVEDYVALHRAAFGTEVMTAEARLRSMREPTYEPELDLVAVAPGGELAAFVVGWIDHEEQARSGRRVGWTDPVGTRPQYQRLGLARALLNEACRRLQERGIEVAATGTGSWNAPMLALAEATGYREVYRSLAFGKDIR
jgi:mycothiol synthase